MIVTSSSVTEVNTQEKMYSQIHGVYFSHTAILSGPASPESPTTATTTFDDYVNRKVDDFSAVLSGPTPAVLSGPTPASPESPTPAMPRQTASAAEEQEPSRHASLPRAADVFGQTRMRAQTAKPSRHARRGCPADMFSRTLRSRKKTEHAVFLSFRGEDTHNTFTGHLYSALANAGINTFIDSEELPRGEAISKELQRAIEGSRISLVVLSGKFADSAWCLEELCKIVECERTLGQMVIPIFYGVDPSKIRNQTGKVDVALMELKERLLRSELKAVEVSSHPSCKIFRLGF